jgi:hypothetical protein
MIIGDQLGAIREKALEAKAILDEIDKLYDPLRDGCSVDEGTGSDQQIQIATMHLNDGIMLLKNEMSELNCKSLNHKVYIG